MAGIPLTGDQISQNVQQSMVEYQRRDIQKAQQAIDVALAGMTDIAAKISRGATVEVKQILKAIQKTEELSGNLSDLVKDLSDFDEDTQRVILDAYTTSQEKLKALKVGLGKAIEDTEKKASKMFQEIEEQMKRAEQQAIDWKAIEEANSDLINDIIVSTGDANTKIDSLMKGIRESSRELMNHEGSSKRAFGRIYEQQTTQLEKELQNYELKIKQLEALKTLDEDQKENLETLRSLVVNTRHELDLVNTATRRDMEQVAEMGDSLWESARKGFKDMKSGFDSFKSIFDTLNLHLITSSLTQGAESMIDVMSEVSRMRGMSYDSVTGVRSGFSSGDTYGGMIGAQDLMRVYQMNNLTTDYLSEIASSVAMFEKETNISNEALNGMLLWAQNTGINKRRTVETLDYLQSIRDNGAPVEDLAAFISENPALVAGHEEEYMTAAGVLRANGMDEYATYLEEMISAGNTLYGTDDTKLRTLFGSRMGEVEQLMNAQEYEKVVQIMMEQGKDISDKLGNFTKHQSSRLDDIYGMGPNLVATLQQMEDPVDFLAKAMDEMRKDTSTIASNAGSAGYIDKFTKSMNEVSTSAVGELITDFEQLTKDHPILTSLATETVAKIGGEVGKNIFSKLGGTITTSIKDKGFVGSLSSPVGVALTSAAFAAAMTTATVAALNEHDENKDKITEVKRAIAAADTPEELEEAMQMADDFLGEVDSNMLTSLGIFDGMSAEDRRDLENAVNKYKASKKSEEIASDIEETGDDRTAVIAKNIFQDMATEYTRDRGFWEERKKSNDVGMKLLEYQSGQGLSDAEMTEVYNALMKTELTQKEYEKMIYDFLSSGNDQIMDDFSNVYYGTKYDDQNFKAGNISVKDAVKRSLVWSSETEGGSGGRGNNPDSNETGLNYVPYDNYLTYLHQGERVLTADQNEEYSMNGINVEVNNELSELIAKLDNAKFQKIVQDGFEYIGKKIMEASEKQSTVVVGGKPQTSTTSMYLANQWG